MVDAHVVSGPVELRSAALQSVLQWHFANDTGANTRQVKITFKLPPDMPVDPFSVSLQMPFDLGFPEIGAPAAAASHGIFR